MRSHRTLFFCAFLTLSGGLGGLLGAVVPPLGAGAVASAAGTTAAIDTQLQAPIVGLAATSDGGGYWEVAADGGIFAFGDAGYDGSMSGRTLSAPVVGMAGVPGSGGYDLVAADGGIFAFGAAPYFGSMGGQPLNAPIVGMALAPGGGGYYEVAADGGIFAFGDAPFDGSMGGHPLNAPIVGMAVTPTGGGYYEIAADGGMFAFGTAAFDGSASGFSSSPVVAGATAPSPTSGGYYEAAADGGIFAFGDAAFDGSASGDMDGSPVVAVAADPEGGYWEASRAGGIYALGAPYDGSLVSPTPVVAPTFNGQEIADLALSQVGNSDGYDYGPSGSTWCGYFTSWVWGQAGVPIGATGEAVQVGTWAQANGGTLLPPSAVPQVGDAVLWEWGGSGAAWPEPGLTYGNILHVNIVVAVLPGDQLVTVGGNESGAVRQLGPFDGQDPSAFAGQAIYAFVQPPA